MIRPNAVIPATPMETGMVTKLVDHADRWAASGTRYVVAVGMNAATTPSAINAMELDVVPAVATACTQIMIMHPQP